MELQSRKDDFCWQAIFHKQKEIKSFSYACQSPTFKFANQIKSLFWEGVKKQERTGVLH